jgi:hypothetical protein
MTQIFTTIQVEALVETAIAVGTASVVGKILGAKNKPDLPSGKVPVPETEVSDDMLVNAAMNMESQTRFGLIRMKQQLIEDNIRHVFKNVPRSLASTGRRFSWSHHSGGRGGGGKELEVMRSKIREAGLESEWEL